MIVTHNMQQAARVSDMTAFLIVKLDADEKHRQGRLVEYDVTEKIFTNPSDSAHRGLRDREGRLMARRASASSTRRSSSRSRHRALEGLDLVAAQLDRAVEAVEHQDIELAELVIADDDVIDGRYLEIHQSILTLLATQAPVATDLRLIAALLHLMKTIERMGDQCVNIAKLIPIAGHEPPADERILKDILTMGKQVKTQIAQASAPSPSATSRWRATWSARTTWSTTSTRRSSGSRSRSATTTIAASGR